MKMKPGYKQTDAGLIPEEWEATTIGEIASFSGGSQPPRFTFRFTPTRNYIRLIQIRDYKSDEFETYRGTI
jgi:type I restriction enzyme, S subunit